MNVPSIGGVNPAGAVAAMFGAGSSGNVSNVGSGVLPGTDGAGAIAGSDLSGLSNAYRNQVLGSDASTLTNGIGGVPDVTGTQQTAGGQAFGSILDGLQNVANLDSTASTAAINASTGSLNDISDYVIAANQAQVATELTTTLRDKALDSFNEIMRMSL